MFLQIWNIDQVFLQVKTELMNIISGIDEIHIKQDCIAGSIVNGRRNSILYNFALDQQLLQKTNKTPKTRPFKKKKLDFILVKKHCF